jgi:hypothetical protein
VRSLPAFFVAVAFGLAGLLLAGHARPDPHWELPYWTLLGHTSQNDTIRLRLDRRRHVRTFEVRTQLRCSNGGWTSTDWQPSDGGAPARFGSRGPRFDAEEFRRFQHSDGSVSTSEGTIRGVIADDEAHGTVTAYTSYRWPDGRREVCSSGRVSWTAR